MLSTPLFAQANRSGASCERPRVQVIASTLRQWMPRPRDTRLSGNAAPDRERFDSCSEPPLEMDGLRRAQRDPWVTHCEKALECMLLIEHWKSPSVSNLDQWQDEIDEAQLGMAEAITPSPSLRQECEKMLAMAWDMGRFRAVARLAKHSLEEAGALNPEPFERAADAQVPKECPYLLKHVAG